MLATALVHRDYLVRTPIPLFVFDNRIELISPGHLPNNLTVEQILRGHSSIRNPFLVSPLLSMAAALVVSTHRWRCWRRSSSSAC
jgi:predicted HTH transcriptional regulator